MALFGTNTQTSRVILDPESQLEASGRQVQEQTLPELQQLVGAGAGEQDVTSGLQAQRSLSEMLQSFSQGGFLPNQQDIQQAQQFTQDIFAPQQAALQQSFEDARTQAAQQAAALGRPVNDPILQAKLVQEQSRQQQLLSAQQTSFSAEQAQNLPLQRLQFAAQGAEAAQGLAQQALQNRQTLLGLGQSVQSQQQQFRLATATRENTQSKTPGLADIAGVALGAAGGLAGLGGVQGINSLFTGAAAAPVQQAANVATGTTSAAPTVAPTAFNIPQSLLPNSALPAQPQAITPGLQNVLDFFGGRTDNLSIFNQPAQQNLRGLGFQGFGGVK